MKKRTRDECIDLRKHILEELTREPQGLRPLCEKLKLGSRTGEKHFDALRLRGLIDHYGPRSATVWAAKAVADRKNAEHKRLQDERSAEADARRERAKLRRQHEDEVLDLELEREKHAGGAEWTRTIRRVPAESVRAQISGPRSVWDLAA